MRQLLQSQRGSIIVFFAVLLVVLLGMAGLAIDVGYWYTEKTKLQNVVDAAVLAGVWELPDETTAKNVGTAFAQKNGINTIALQKSATDPDVLEGTASCTAPRFFSKLFLDADVPISAVAKAKLTKSAINVGVAPIGLPEGETWVPGSTYKLKYADNFSVSNTGALDLGNGANDFRNYLINGYNGDLYIDQVIETKPGEMKGPTEQALETLYGKTIVCVEVEIVDTKNNGKMDLRITGFQEFKIVPTPDSEKNTGNIYGIYIGRLDVGTVDNGVAVINSAKLIQ